MRHILITLVPLVLLALTSCKHIESDWAEAQRTNTVRAFDSFIERHPNSSFTDQARQRIDALVIEGAYKNMPQFSGNEGATRITIESRESGSAIFAGAVRLLVDPVRDDEVRIKVEPENAAVKFDLSSLKMDEKTGDLWSFVSLRFANGGALPAKWRKTMFGGEGVTAVFPDAPNSIAVSIRVNPGVGYTDYAGLRFKTPATAAIRGDGTVEVDIEGLEAADKAGQLWISRGVTIEGREAFVMWKKE